MKKIKLFKRLLLVLMILMTCSPQLRAQSGFWSDGAWNFEYNNGTSNIWQASAINLKDKDRTVNLGTLTTFSLRGCWVKTYSNNGYYTQDMRWYYGIGDYTHDYFKDDGWAHYDPRTWSFCNDDHNFITYDVIAEAPNNPGENTLWMYWYLDHEYHSGQEAKSLTCYVNFTIPGFTTTTISKNFTPSVNVPVNTESETTISFGAHYGTALTTSNCSITGTNRTEFSVRSITESEVVVAFTPTSTGTRTATLTITDAHSKKCTITLSGTAVAKGTTTRLYFNDYNYHDAWIDKDAKYRFSCAYNSGVYTHYDMTRCTNSAYNYYADVEIKTGSIHVDRYNPSSPYNTWNSFTPSLTSSNCYAVVDNYSDYKYYGFATNHPYMDVTGGNIYYDNSKSGLTNTLYLVIGHDYNMNDGGSANEHSTPYALANITNTKLYYRAHSDAWHKADYYAFIGSSSSPSDGEWGSNDLSSKATSSSYTDIFRDIMDLQSGNTYLGFAATKTNGALSITKSPTLNTTQTFNYALSTDGGSSYPALTSGPNTPGQLSMSTYEFTNAKCTTVVAKDAQTLSANATIYTKAVSSVAYTGTTVLTESNTRSGYTFMGWYKGDTQITNGSTHSYTYFPQNDSTFTARYKAHRYTINFNKNDAQYDGTTSYGSMDPMTNVVYDQSSTLPANGFHRIGYKFDGWATAADGSVAYADEATAVLNLTTSDGGSVTLYAKWSTDANTFTNNGGDGVWDNEENWSAGKVPENDDATITINQPVTISGGSYHIGELSFGTNGSLTIEEDGALEVAGNITNDVASKIEINSDGSNQGALIFNSTGSTAATVNMTMNAASGKFQFIAIPVSYVSVSEKFPGSTVYTYGWSNTKHDWERRGYYDGFSSFEAVLVKGQGSASFSGYLVETGERVCGGSYAASYGNVYMYGNSWTAPITMSEEGFDNASIGIMNGSANSWDGVIAGQVIPALQAFAVAVNSGGGSITINYDRDVRNPSNPNAPLKAPQRLTSEVQEPITVYVSGNEMQTRIRLFEDATRFTDEFDNGWEALYMEGYGYAGEMYAIGTDKMNVLATNNLEGTVVGFVPGQAENYTISFEGDGKGYYLNDIKMEEATLIDEGNTYEFTSDEKTNATRFVISKTPIKKTPTSVENIGDGVKARKQMINGALYIIRDGRIYNAEGSLVK